MYEEHIAGLLMNNKSRCPGREGGATSAADSWFVCPRRSRTPHTPDPRLGTPCSHGTHPRPNLSYARSFAIMPEMN